MDKVMHFHLPANDIGRAKKFYQEIFGWEIIDAGMKKAMVGGKVNYHLANTVATDENGIPLEPGAINGASRCECSRVLPFIVYIALCIFIQAKFQS